MTIESSGYEISVKKLYDPLTGRLVKEIKPSDILTITTSSTKGAVGSTFAFDTISSYFDYYITNVWAVTTATIGIEIQAGTSTIVSFYGQFGTGNQLKINTTRETPIAKISGAATVSIAGITGSSACAWISGVREPKFAYVETV